jgi:acyl phosphate:glycerol-3-phosphate acyltransferase
MEISTEIFKIFLVAFYSYLLGSISFAKIIGRIKGVDIQKEGSKKPGATNTGRVLGKRWGFLVWILDAGKAISALTITNYFFPGPWSVDWLSEFFAGLSFLFVIVGHNFSIWLKFQGGAGVSSFIGGLFALLIFGLLPWQVIVIMLAAWIFILRVLTKRQMSTTNLLFGAGILIFIVFIPVLVSMAVFIAIAVLLIWWGHRENLKRISKGVESSLPFDEMVIKIIGKNAFLRRRVTKILAKIPDNSIARISEKISKLIEKFKNNHNHH